MEVVVLDDVSAHNQNFRVRWSLISLRMSLRSSKENASEEGGGCVIKGGVMCALCSTMLPM